MANSSTRTTGNDLPADPGGTRPAATPAGKSTASKTAQNVASGDRNKSPTKPETRIKK